jgi:hypothetical protein
VISLYKYPFFLPDQNSISHPTSIGGDFGVPDFSKYKRGGFDLHFWEGGC